MKQKPSRWKNFLVAATILAIIFPAESLFSSLQAEAAASKNYIEGEVVVKIAPGADIGALVEEYGLAIELVKSGPDGDLYILKSRKRFSTKKITQLLKRDSRFLSVQPNFKYKILTRQPNDKYFSAQWPFFDTATVTGGVSAPSAWDAEVKKQTKVAIAVIDTGVNANLSEISKQITSGKSKGRNIDNPKKKPSDTDGHGTFLAGIIAAQTNNKKGVVGASFFGNLKVMPLKFDFTTDQAISAIGYAKSKNIPIINASWGSYGQDGYDPLLKDAIAAFPGVFIAAAGNGRDDVDEGYDHDGSDPTMKMYPCDFDLANIICVAATGRDGALTEYSDFGATSVDVGAPGGTDSDPIFGLDRKKNKFTHVEGTSLSTAFVSAEAGLILSKKPTLSSSQIIEIIKNSVDLEPSLAGKTVTGGKVNFQKALSEISKY
jgi:hypothetical protein